MEPVKILVIDDESSITRAVYRLLITQDENYEILTANNGQEGLELYYRESPFLIILDLNMPVMGGLEFLDKINLSSSDLCSVIILTGRDDNESIKLSFEMGASAFLRKPFNDYEFMGMVRHSVALKKTQKQLITEMKHRDIAWKTVGEQRERFISVLIHDLKNPMLPIANYTRRLIEGRVKSEEDKLKKLHVIEESSEDILRIIEETLSAFKYKKDIEIFRTEDVDIKELLLLVAEEMSVTAETGCIEIYINGKVRKDWSSLEKIDFVADRNQMKTMLENLLSNAIKYADNRVEIVLDSSENGLKISVSDNGPGIPEDLQEKIFEEYFQVPGSKKGTGLGLYSVKKVVQNHKGDITVSCPLDGGTRFEILLPVYGRNS